MKWLASIIALVLTFSALGCFSVKTWSGDVYDCPKELLEGVAAQLALCKNSQPVNGELVK
jgi:outer membrane lipoprotein SlyB